ncbi:hypothetical protein [Massilia sp. Mn16-1_5]|uniref:hypothetical protein n=1 Tax=Massilia sp. Mn16-1_5 TaxID=2079199 RepID=UPI00109E37F7|nr:hypothetical protein [Massilia sp. Mn16-1_5]
MEQRSVGDIEGPWIEPEFDSNLIRRCRENWAVSIGQVANGVLATFIRQRVGLSIVVPEAKCRIEARYDDDSEMYDGELAAALADLS